MTVSRELSKEARILAGGSLAKLAKLYPRLFMAMAHHRTTNGARMRFSDKKWLTDIYKDMARELVIIKCSQVHMTEHAICSMFTFAKRGLRGMYVLPSKEHRKTFVADRVNKQKDYSSLYAAAIKEGDNESDSNVYKSIFGLGWKFVGSNVRKDFFEFPCQVLFFDEFDELHQGNLQYAYDRVADCAEPIIWKFGNPTRENYGISKEYMASTQNEWHVTCEHCETEQILDWFTHFVQQSGGVWTLKHPTGAPICTNCGKDFDRLGYGRWIKLNPNSEVSGYRITRLFTNKNKKPNDIVWLFRKWLRAQNDPTALQVFHNNYLGITYEHRDFKLSRETLDRCALKQPFADYDPNLFRAIMGVDQGKLYTCTITVMIDGVPHDIKYKNVTSLEAVEALEDTYNVVCTVIDAQGGGYAETRKFVRAKGHRYMCYYRPKDQLKGSTHKIDAAQQIVEVNRTEILDLMVKQLREGKARLPMDYATQENGDFLTQMLVPSRITDSGGRPVWTKGVDHFFHSCAYRYVAQLVSGMYNSISSGRSWHASGANIAQSRTKEPKSLDIGGNTTQEQQQKPVVKRRWFV